MNFRAPPWLPAVSLIILALASGFGWRIELESTTGWASLAWVDTFHWTVPVAVAGFIVWASLVAPVRQKMAFCCALGGLACVGYFGTGLALRLFFATGPSAFFFIVDLGNGNADLGMAIFQILQSAVLLVLPFTPLVFCFVCRCFGASISLFHAVTSTILYLLSWPIAVLVRMPFEDIGGADLIHALKSGFVIPFLVLSLGYPLLYLKPKKTEA